MIISRTPLRMSFVGGGSDMHQFYRKYGGAVLSTAIDKYIYITANRKFDNGIRLSYSVTEEVERVADIRHGLVRHAMEFLNIEGGVELTTIADIPSRGTGLGSSSSFAVGLLHVLHAFQGRFVSAASLAEQACHIEIDRLGETIGKQDQYAAAIGGLTFYEFNADETVRVSPVVMDSTVRARLEARLLMFYTGITRQASSILSGQAAELAGGRKDATMQRMVALCYDLKDALSNNDIDGFGEIIHENWVLKKQMAEGISNGLIDEAYAAARAAGALGGKLLGAGAGGFLAFYAHEEKHPAIIRALSGLRHIPFRFDAVGSRIIFAE
jgi:D-glycero-alpha-D-manno-heptose-7-phosphate kinase